MQDCGDDGIQIAEGAGRPAAQNEADAEQKILVDDRARLTRQLHQERQTAQVIVHERDGRAVNRHFAAGRPHRNTHVARRQRRRIIDAVAHDGDAIAAGFDFADKLDFVLRQTLGHDLFATDLTRHASGDRLPITGDHRDAAHARVLQSGKRFARFGAGLVLQAHPTDALAVARDKNQAVAFGLVQVHGFFESFFHAVVFQPLLAPDDDFRAINARLDTASGGFREVLRLCQWHSGFLGQLRERLGRGVVAVFLGRGRQPEQFCRLRFAQRRQTADGEFARRQRSGLVEDESVDARRQLDVADVLDQNAQTSRRGKRGHHSRG